MAGTFTLIREYVWFEGAPIAVIEGGVVYYVRSDHIGKPVFATDATGTKVWEATYLPFGGVHTSSGANINLRFPGQWFQSESGLHQNWMRDYDPTTGRYIQADPLGLVDGASVYGYVGQNPARYIDPYGLTASCPSKPPIGSSSWVPYYGNPNTFHCGFGGFLENRDPTPEDPIAECFYDEDQTLVEENCHKYGACGGTPDQYGPDSPWDHTFNDTGGILDKGWDAYWESRRYFRDQAERRRRTCVHTANGISCP